MRTWRRLPHRPHPSEECGQQWMRSSRHGVRGKVDETKKRKRSAKMGCSLRWSRIKLARPFDRQQMWLVAAARHQKNIRSWQFAQRTGHRVRVWQCQQVVPLVAHIENHYLAVRTRGLCPSVALVARVVGVFAHVGTQAKRRPFRIAVSPQLLLG